MHAMLLFLPCTLLSVAPGLTLAAGPKKAEGSYEVTAETLRAIEQAAPTAPLVRPEKPRKLLVYGRVPTHPESVACCFKAMEILGRKTGAFEAQSTGDPAVFLPESLQQFDAVVMNNTHERTPLLPWNFEELGKDQQQEALRRQAVLEKSLTEFVASGRGLVGIHGAAAIRDELRWLAEMIGGQHMGHFGGMCWVRPEQPDHPLCAYLAGKSFAVQDEMYVFRKALSREPLRREGLCVLLSLDLTRMKDPGLRTDGDYAVSWIRPYGKGRVFYCALGHAKTAYTNPALLMHYLAGIQWAIGDLKAEPSAKP